LSSCFIIDQLNSPPLLAADVGIHAGAQQEKTPDYTPDIPSELVEPAMPVAAEEEVVEASIVAEVEAADIAAAVN
jgi:hypothetical protein